LPLRSTRKFQFTL